MDSKTTSLLRSCSNSEIRTAAPAAEEHTSMLGPVELMSNYLLMQ